MQRKVGLMAFLFLFFFFLSDESSLALLAQIIKH